MGHIPLFQRLKSFFGALTFAVVVSAGIGTADYFFLRSAVQQIGARGYPITWGQVVESEVTTTTDSDGAPSHRPRIRFTYEVNGQSFEGDRWRYGNLGLSDPAFAKQVVARFAPGTAAPVHYNPDDPGDAVLSTDLDGTDAFLLLFMSGFNLSFGLGSWYPCLLWLRLLIFNPRAGGVPLIARGDTVAARLPRYGPIVVAGAVLAGILFVSVFITALFMHMTPPLEFVFGVWAAALGAAVLAYVGRRLALSRGRCDLIVHRNAGMLSLPATAGHKSPLDVAFSDVQRIEIKCEVYSSPGYTNHAYVPELVVFGDDHRSLRRERIALFNFGSRAEGFAEWLRGEIGLKGGV